MSDSIYQSNISEDIVVDIIDELWISISKEITAAWLKTMDISMAASLAMLKINKLTSLATVQHDGMLPPPPPSSSSSSFSSMTAVANDNTNGNVVIIEVLQPDGEPSPASIDPWARGVLQTRPSQPGSMTGYKNSSNNINSTPSIGGSSRKSSQRDGTVRSKSERGGGGTYNNTTDNMNDSIIELDDPADFSSLEQSNAFLMLQKLKSNKVNEAIISEENKSEFDLLQVEIAKATANLKKGKKVIIDKDGNIVPIVLVNADNLPSLSVNLNLSIKKDLQPTSGSSKNRKNHDNTKNNGKVIRVTGSRTIEDNEGYFFTATNSIAGSMANPDQIPLNPGITLNSNGLIRKGPPVASDPNKPSRKDLLRQSSGAANPAVSNNNDYNIGFNESTVTDVGGHNGGMDGSTSIMSTNIKGFNDNYSVALANSIDLNAMDGAKKAVRKETIRARVNGSKIIGRG